MIKSFITHPLILESLHWSTVTADFLLDTVYIFILQRLFWNVFVFVFWDVFVTFRLNAKSKGLRTLKDTAAYKSAM